MSGNGRGRGQDVEPRRNSPLRAVRPGNGQEREPDRKRGAAQRAEAIPLLIAGAGVTEVAEAVGVTPRSVGRWLRQGAIAEEVAEGKAEINAEARRFLGSKRSAAVRLLWEICESGSREDMGRVKALELFMRSSGLLLPEPEALPVATEEERMSDAQIDKELRAAYNKLGGHQ